jgi:hypothetical protein
MNNNYSQELFKQIQSQLGTNIKLAKPISEILNVSENAAYRKLNGETALSIEEFFTLANHYTININNINKQPGNFVFSGNLVYNDIASVTQYFIDSMEHLQMIENNNGVLYNLSKDIPLFYYFHYRELGWFKVFFMLKYILLDPKFKDQKFDINFADENLLQKAKEYSYSYQQINTAEVWNVESVNTTLHQLEFACTTGIISDINLVEKIITQFEQVLQLIQLQAEKGLKYNYQQLKTHNKASFTLYHNDLYLAHNSYLLEIAKNRIAFVSFGVFNYMHTQDESFSNYTYEHWQNIKSKSISLLDNDPEREMFFTKLFQKIAQVKIKCNSLLKDNW